MKISIDRLKTERKITLEYKDFQFQNKDLREHTIDPLIVKLNISLIGNENVKLEGELEGNFELVCDRCCEKFLQYKKTKINIICEIEKDEIADKVIHIDTKIKDIVLSNFPMKILCNENCKGICYVCGVNLNKEKCKCK
ncbi:MAG: DUF177 domain-containing protein [Endomicrobiia bacterium]